LEENLFLREPFLTRFFAAPKRNIEGEAVKLKESVDKGAGEEDGGMFEQIIVGILKNGNNVS